MNPKEIPQNFVEVSPGNWAHPSRVPKEYREKVRKFGQGYVNEFCGPPPTHETPPPSHFDPPGGVKTPKRIRQSSKPILNKLEQEWFDHLTASFPRLVFYPQTTRFKLGNGIWYKPDVTCPYFHGLFTCWEVKGPFAHRGGFENLKVAASKYPEFKWILVWKEGGQWKEQTVLP